MNLERIITTRVITSQGSTSCFKDWKIIPRVITREPDKNATRPASMRWLASRSSNALSFIKNVANIAKTTTTNASMLINIMSGIQKPKGFKRSTAKTSRTREIIVS